MLDGRILLALATGCLGIKGKHIVAANVPEDLVGIAALTATKHVIAAGKERAKRIRRSKELGKCGPRIAVELVSVRSRLTAAIWSRLSALQSILTVIVEDVALLFVRQHLVRLGDLLEALLRLWALVLVGMVFECQFAVGLLDLIVAGLALEAQNLVEVFAHLSAENIGETQTNAID